jgi:hypothetical protein
MVGKYCGTSWYFHLFLIKCEIYCNGYFSNWGCALLELDVMGLAQPNRPNPHPSFCLTKSHDILMTVSTSAGEGRTDAAAAGPPAQPPAPAVIPLHRLPALAAGPAPWPLAPTAQPHIGDPCRCHARAWPKAPGTVAPCPSPAVSFCAAHLPASCNQHLLPIPAEAKVPLDSWFDLCWHPLCIP